MSGRMSGSVRVRVGRGLEGDRGPGVEGARGEWWGEGQRSRGRGRARRRVEERGGGWEKGRASGEEEGEREASNMANHGK